MKIYKSTRRRTILLPSIATWLMIGWCSYAIYKQHGLEVSDWVTAALCALIYAHQHWVSDKIDNIIDRLERMEDK